MMKPLTEKQTEILEYSKTATIKETAEHFGLSPSQVSYVIGKNKELEMRSLPSSGGFIRMELSDNGKQEADAVLMKKEEEICFYIGGTKIRMGIADFRRAFIHD